MRRKSLVILTALAFGLSLAAANNTPSQNSLSVSEIVSKNAEARGGLQAWRAVQAMTLTGNMGVGGNQRDTLAVPPPAASNGMKMNLPSSRPTKEMEVPFVMILARPHKERFELVFSGKTAIQTYDGTNGWKVRPFLNRTDVEPFTQDELKIAASQPGLDGFLLDSAAKGTQVQLEGTEQVEGRNAYKLKLTLKNGDVTHVWVDAQTFLEAKVEGQPRRLDGTPHPVEVYYRDYRTVNGLQIPFVLETHVLPVAKNAIGVRDTPVPPEKITIDKVVVNPTLDASSFSKPQVAAAAAAPKATAPTATHAPAPATKPN